MSIVADNNDSQMYSKAGRYTTEKYMIFQHKDEILHNKKRVCRVSSAPHMAKEKEKVNIFKNYN